MKHGSIKLIFLNYYHQYIILLILYLFPIKLMRKSFCLNSVVSFQNINNAPTNTSTSKNLWTFNKQQRFSNQKVYCDQIYNLHHLKPTKYGIGIGKGKKSDFTKDLTVSPSASRYIRNSFIDDNKSHNKGCSISIGRQKSLQNGYILLDPLKVPGPGTYDLKNRKGLSYSMRKKTRVINKMESIEPQNDTPGPGTYQNPEALSAKGNYTVSKHMGTGATLFNPRRSARFLPIKSEAPGPGAYVTPVALNSTSKYFNSKHEGTGSRAFSVDKKKSTFDQIAKNFQINPGPGSYRNTSQFGHYDGDVYNRSRQNSRSRKRLANS